MKLWIATEFYSPYSENTIGRFVKGIAERLEKERDVQVVFPCKRQNLGDWEHIPIHSVYPFLFARKNLILRMVGQFIMSLQFFFILLRKTRKDDIVVCFTQPVFFMFFCVLLKKLKRTKIAIVNYDLFPEALIGTGVMKANAFYHMLQYPFDKAYQRFDSIISIGDDMTAVLRSKILSQKIKITTIRNWSSIGEVFYQEKTENSILKEYDLTKKMVLSFAGNIGRAQGIDKLLHLIDRLDHDPRIHFLFFGKGVAVDSFLTLKKKNRNIELITYAGYCQATKNQLLNACDVGIVSLLDEMKGYSVPSKTYDILASGHPILFLGHPDSEIGKLVNEHEIGWVCGLEDLITFKKIIHDILNDPLSVKLKGLKARNIAETLYAKEFILEQYAATLQL